MGVHQTEIGMSDKRERVCFYTILMLSIRQSAGHCSFIDNDYNKSVVPSANATLTITITVSLNDCQRMGFSSPHLDILKAVVVEKEEITAHTGTLCQIVLSENCNGMENCKCGDTNDKLRNFSVIYQTQNKTNETLRISVVLDRGTIYQLVTIDTVSRKINATVVMEDFTTKDVRDNTVAAELTTLGADLYNSTSSPTTGAKDIDTNFWILVTLSAGFGGIFLILILSFTAICCLLRAWKKKGVRLALPPFRRNTSTETNAVVVADAMAWRPRMASPFFAEQGLLRLLSGSEGTSGTAAYAGIFHDDMHNPTTLSSIHGSSSSISDLQFVPSPMTSDTTYASALPRSVRLHSHIRTANPNSTSVEAQSQPTQESSGISGPLQGGTLANNRFTSSGYLHPVPTPKYRLAATNTPADLADRLRSAFAAEDVERGSGPPPNCKPASAESAPAEFLRPSSGQSLCGNNESAGLRFGNRPTSLDFLFGRKRASPRTSNTDCVASSRSSFREKLTLVLRSANGHLSRALSPDGDKPIKFERKCSSRRARISQILASHVFRSSSKRETKPGSSTVTPDPPIPSREGRAPLDASKIAHETKHPKIKAAKSVAGGFRLPRDRLPGAVMVFPPRTSSSC